MKYIIILACIGAMAVGCAPTERSAHTTPTTYGSGVISNPAPASSTLYVPPPSSGAFSSDPDAALSNTVRQQLARYSNLDAVAPNVQVSAQHGIVTLRGNVQTEQDRQFVQNVARNTPGVTGINDELNVAPQGIQPTGRLSQPGQSANNLPGEMFNLHVQGLNPTDRNLAQRILDGLQTDQSLTALFPNVDINVQGGRVILNGTVQNQRQKQAIASAVQRSAGANNVIDQLQVQPSP